MWVWIVSGLVVVVAFGVLGFALWRLYTLVMALGRDVSAAAERLGESTAALESVAPDRTDNRPRRP